MKKLIPTLLLITLILFACEQSGDIQLDSGIASNDEQIQIITPENAIIIATKAAEHLYPSKSRSESRTVSDGNLKIITSGISRGNQNDTLLYVVNFDNNNGYAIVPAVDIDKDVLAVVETGSYDPEIGSDNPGLNLYLEAAVDYTMNHSSMSKKTPITIDTLHKPVTEDDLHPAFDYRYDTIHHWSIKPQLEGMRWGQDKIYGTECPNKITGCVPTAIASIITAVKKNIKAEAFTFTYPDNKLNTCHVDWNNAFKHKGQPDTILLLDQTIKELEWECGEYDSRIVHLFIASLMRQIGYDGKADYKNGKTSVAKSKCQDLLNKYLPDKTISKFKDYTYVKAQTDLNTCILLMGGDGHAWVADGYDQLDWYEYFAEWDFTNKQWIVKKDRPYSRKLIHFCWGWNGMDDGYFEGDVFNTTQGKFKNPDYISVNIYK